MKSQVRKWLIYGIGGFLMLMAGLNINKQAGVWLGAKRMNEELKIEIERLEKENREMEQKIEYATSSAFVSRQAREKFGLGGADDYWLELPEEEDVGKRLYEVDMEEKKAKYEEWLNLFR